MDVDLIHAILTCVTAGPGLGFNRAALFLASEDATRLEAAMAIGPASPEEAQMTWSRLAGEPKSLSELIGTAPHEVAKSGFQARIEGVIIPLDEDAGGRRGGSYRNALLEAYFERRVVRINDTAALGELPAPLRNVFDGSEIVCVPLVAKDRSIGLILADNAFTREPIDEERLSLLHLLALLAGLALDNARMKAEVEEQAADLRRALAELEATHERLLHSERLATVGSVVARVSHEIRNPLATIGGFAKSLGRSPGRRDHVEEKAAIIAAEVEKLEQLLKEMLDFTSPHPPRLAPCDLNDLIASFAALHRDELHESGIGLRTELASDLRRVLCDRHQIERVLMNLLQNARYALEDVGARVRTITLATQAAADRSRILFTDNGRGIPPEDEPHLFEPFFSTRPRGTGLGLATVKKIIDDHHGRIEVTSAIGEGTRFAIDLPTAEGGTWQES